MPTATRSDYAGTHGPLVQSAGGGAPKDRATFSLTWDRGPLAVTGAVNYVGPIKMVDHKGEVSDDGRHDGITTPTPAWTIRTTQRAVQLRRVHVERHHLQRLQAAVVHDVRPVRASGRRPRTWTSTSRSRTCSTRRRRSIRTSRSRTASTTTRPGTSRAPWDGSSRSQRSTRSDPEDLKVTKPARRKPAGFFLGDASRFGDCREPTTSAPSESPHRAGSPRR